MTMQCRVRLKPVHTSDAGHMLHAASLDCCATLLSRCTCSDMWSCHKHQWLPQYVSPTPLCAVLTIQCLQQDVISALKRTHAG